MDSPGIVHHVCRTGLGPIRFALRGERLVGIKLPGTGAMEPGLPADAGLAADVAGQLQAFAEDPRFEFDLPIAFHGSEFQQRVWMALRAIPAGEVRTYGELASLLGSAPRAIGGACRANPLPLVVPCHRVIAAGGLGGFAGRTAGSRLDLKRRLLAREGVRLAR